jgi:hypothetical protein
MKSIRNMTSATRSKFNADLKLYAARGFTMRETADSLIQDFPEYAVTYATVKNMAAAQRIMFTGTKVGTPSSAAPTVDQTVEAETIRLRQRELAKELTQLNRTEAKRRKYVETIEAGLRPYEPTPLTPGLDHPDRSEHSWLMQFSDWHVGQSTPIQTTGGIYEQTTEITRWQIEKMVDALRSIHAVQSRGYDIRKVCVVFNGDLLENDSMRASQAAGIDRFVTQQAVEVFDLMGYTIRQLLTFPGVESVEVHNVGGNHDRTTQKAGNAGLGELDYVDTYAWLVGTLLARAMVDEPRVTFTNWETFFGYTTFCGQKVIFEHGSSFRGGTGSYGGVPWYPVVNAANKMIDMLGGGDIVLFGHLHQPAVLPIKQNAWVVLNGALPATTTYVQSAMKGLRTPTQWLLNLHEEHGLVEFHPLYAPPASLQAPGHLWTP